MQIAELEEFWVLVESFHPIVFPVRDKTPLVKWSTIAESVRDPDARAHGLATGSRSGGLVVIDLDVKPGENGIETLRELESRWGALPETLTVQTPSGGRHLYFHTTGRVKSTVRVVGPGIDIKAEGGYVVIPGSVSARGTYTVVNAYPVAELPAAWLARLPVAGSSPAPVPVDHETVDVSELRERVAEAARGKRGQGWEAWRKAVRGERMFRIEGGGGEGEIVHGVDVFISQEMLWPLAHTDGLFKISGEAIADLLEPSLSILRADARESKWTREHVISKWARVSGKAAAADAAAGAAFAERLAEIARGERESPLPPLVQINDSFFVLDDERSAYVEYVTRSAVVGWIEQLWPGKREIEVRTEKGGARTLTVEEARKAYGRMAEDVVCDLSVDRPEIRGPVLVLPPARVPVEPLEDPEVDQWLEALAGPRRDLLDRWIVWAGVEHARATAPALVLVGKSTAGKSLLAAGIARAGGYVAPSDLGRALGRFRSAIRTCPVLFADEGFPRGPTGVPLTEEFRALITATSHVIERKGSDKSLTLLGGVRVILAANALDRLFSAKGVLNADDVSALMRRLISIPVEGANADRAKALAEGLGAYDNDPKRLERVAGHLRWIQITRAGCAAPEPSGGEIGRELRAGSDLFEQAIDRISDGLSTSAEWVHVDEAEHMLWVRVRDLAGLDHSRAVALGRALLAYTKIRSKQRRTHPGNGAAESARWTALDLQMLRRDGHLD